MTPEQQAAAETARMMIPALNVHDEFAFGVWVELVHKALPDLAAKFDAATTPREQEKIRREIIRELFPTTEETR
jgi:hypothetical protein